MAFWVAVADPVANPTAARQLSPAPTRVSYDAAPLGSRRETADGRLIVQQPTLDNRVRAWEWVGYPGFLGAYERQFQFLSNLRSRYRYEAGLSPYIWVKEDSTKLLTRKVVVTGTAGSGTSNTLTVSGLTADAAVGGQIEIFPASIGGSGTGAYQLASITANTSTVVTIAGTWGTIPTGAAYAITYFASDWFQARVVEVSRELRPDGGNVRYDVSRFAFVIEDVNHNGVG